MYSTFTYTLHFVNQILFMGGYITFSNSDKQLFVTDVRRFISTIRTYSIRNYS